MVGVGGLSLPSKLLSAGGGREKDAQTRCGSPGKERCAEPCPPLPRTGSEPGADRPGRRRWREGWTRGEAHQGRVKRSGMEKRVPMAMCLGLALPCPRSGPGWATPRGRRSAHCAEVSAGARAPHGPAGHHPADTRAAAAPWPGAQGELRRPAARCGKRPLPRSALHIPPLWPSPRRQLQALLRRRSGESTSRRLPQARSLPHSQARHSFASSIRAMLLRLPAARQPASRPAAAPDKPCAVSARPPAPL